MDFFFTGRAHDYYGLLAIIVVALILYAWPPLRDHPFIYWVIVVLASGVFVDLWAHKWRH